MSGRNAKDNAINVGSDGLAITQQYFDRLIKRIETSNTKRIARKDSIIRGWRLQCRGLRQAAVKQGQVHASQLDALRSDYEFALEMNRAEHAAELDTVKEALQAYGEAVPALELKTRIALHNASMLERVKQFELAFPADNDRDKMIYKDLAQSLMLNAIHLRDPYTHVFVSDVACQMGYNFTRGQLAMVGVPIAHRYRLMHGVPPSKHSQFVEGKVNQVNSYTEEFRPVIQEELVKAWGQPIRA
jgi:hypothetical protein